MPSPDSPIRFVPTGVADTLIGDNASPGKCSALTNLIFDSGTPGVLVARPAAVGLIDFSTGLTPVFGG